MPLLLLPRSAAGGIALVQRVAAVAPNVNAAITVPIVSTAGNGLIAVVAANIQDASWDISSVTDSAHNLWIKIGSVATANNPAITKTQVLISMWAAVLTNPVTSVTATMANSFEGSGVALEVFEMRGVTNISSLDVSAVASTNSGTTLTPGATTTNPNDFVLAAVAIADYVATVSHTADTWTAFPEVAQDGSSVDQADSLRLDAAYTVTGSAGAISTTWTVSAARPIAGIIAAFKGGTPDTSNPNPVWPQLSTKVAFGVQPNTAAGVYAYGTDISARVRSAQPGYGAPYELGDNAAGTNEVELYNQDGAFDATNASSPYWPNVLDYTPFQQLAAWNGITYGVFTGFIERWPLEWDEVLTGAVKAVGVDTYATLAKVTLKTCMQHEVLLDAPWAYWPLNDASGSSLASNLASGPGSSVLLYPVPPRRTGPGTAAFGAATTLAGDPNTGWGQTSDDTSKDDQGWTLGSGIIPSSTFPSIASGGSVTVEAWAMYPLRTAKTTLSTLLALKSSATSWTGHQILAVQVSQASSTSTTGNLYVATWNGSGTVTTVDTGVRCYADARWHHFAVVYSSASLKVYADGVLVYSATPSIATLRVDAIDVGGSQDSWDASTIGTGSYAHVAVYGSALTAARINSHFRSGHDGFPEDSGSRVGRILTYAGWKGARALDSGSSVLAACSSIGGQKVSEALTDVAKWELGLVFVDSLGRITFRSRSARFNQTSRGTFGDGVGEYHYADDVAFDYDPTYQYNDISVTRTGPHGTTGVAQFSGDPSGTIAQYFTSSLPVEAALLSDAQAQDRAAFLYSLYSVPQLRVRSLTITPSADPTLWPVALGAQPGDVYTVKRRPLGSPNTISLTVMITEVKHAISPGEWKTTFSMIPANVTPRGANILPYSVQSVETGISGWSAGANTTIAQSSTQAKDGQFALQMTATANGGLAAWTATWYPVKPGAVYTFTCWLWSPAALTGGIGLDWRDAAGTYLASAVTATSLAANGWTFVQLSATAPLNAYNVTPTLGNGITATAGQQFYGDVFVVTGVLGASGPWRLSDPIYSVLGTSTIPAY
ncbi:LamG-like jellyroll fold domain-containing protein [Streptomyces mirabilis]|uniref:LamG-like jellyroll fold domain-containing protein n=1 Tax=Streptomyces mirabilis TaxID=68239 RepID=UPI0036B53B38